MLGFKEECQPERACKYSGKSLVIGFCSFDKLCIRDAKMSKSHSCLFLFSWRPEQEWKAMCMC